jgi:hypothetical protein
MPTVVYDEGMTGNGTHMYAYSGLRFLPGRANDAFPLDVNSVILAIDGIGFNSPRAFSEPLEHAAPGQRYVEVIYVHREAAGNGFRRAYIPLLPRSLVAEDWRRMADSNPILQPHNGGFLRAAIIATLLGKVIYDLSNTEIGLNYRRKYEECVRRREPGIIC